MREDFFLLEKLKHLACAHIIMDIEKELKILMN